ncbi:MAG: HNH endonuclease [Saprospiraceae bacterium]|nr:HNH endonuclease [Saprospiraceae bacterium]
MFCQICGFDFQQVYGKVGEDYIEAHHTLPLSEIENEQTQTQIEDIALLCSNCHKMIHRKRPWLTMTKIKDLIANQK